MSYWELKELREQFAAVRRIQSVNSGSARRLEDRIEDLEEENGHLKLVLAAVINLLIHKGMAQREELLTIARVLDEADGKQDNKLAGYLTPDGAVTAPPARPSRDSLELLKKAVEHP